MGDRVVAAGVGLRLVPADVNPESVRASVFALLEETSNRTGAQRLKREIEAMPGLEEAVHLIEEVTATSVLNRGYISSSSMKSMDEISEASECVLKEEIEM